MHVIKVNNLDVNFRDSYMNLKIKTPLNSKLKTTVRKKEASYEVCNMKDKKMSFIAIVRW